MTGRQLKQLKNLSGISMAILIAHILLLSYAISGLSFALDHPRNLGIVLVLMCWAFLVVVVSTWYLVLFAVHVKHAKFSGSGLSIERYFAPALSGSKFKEIHKIVAPVPSLSGDGFQRGVLLFGGATILYVPDNLSDAPGLLDKITGPACGPNVSE